MSEEEVKVLDTLTKTRTIYKRNVTRYINKSDKALAKLDETGLQVDLDEADRRLQVAREEWNKLEKQLIEIEILEGKEDQAELSHLEEVEERIMDQIRRFSMAKARRNSQANDNAGGSSNVVMSQIINAKQPPLLQEDSDIKAFRE